MALTPEIIEAVRERSSLAELAGETMELKRSGRHLSGLCPFHTEKTPSFYIREEQNSFRCFGCGRSGSVFDFVMETRNLSFRESVYFLANRIGLKIPQRAGWFKGKSGADREHSRTLRRLLGAASGVYIDALKTREDAAVARDYLSTRGITVETARAFGVGWAPDSWEFIASATMRRLSQGNAGVEIKGEASLRKHLFEVGLLRPKSAQEGADATSFYDTLRGRVLFPICRSDGVPIAFGGRTIVDKKDAPKYLNTTESVLYEKRKTFFGMAQAIEAIRKKRSAVIVEGYFDVILPWQVGLKNVLATCGTALSDGHVRVLKRLVDRVTILFDGDTAGRKAAARCFELFLGSGIEVSACLLDEGVDPDSLARESGLERLQQILKERNTSLLDLFIEQEFASLETNCEAASSVSRGKVAKAFVRAAARVENPVELEALVRQAANVIGVTPTSLFELLGRSPTQTKGSAKDEANDEQRRRAFEHSLAHVCRQVVLGVLVEPSLSVELSKLKLDSDSRQVISLFPARVQGFIKEVASGSFSSIATGDEFSELPLERVLAEHGLWEEELLPAAMRLAGGGRFSASSLIEEVDRWSRRVAGKAAVDTIRVREREARDHKELEDLAQKKLLERRRGDSR